jgi:hypothetical protein
MTALFTPYVFGPEQKAELDRNGHLCLPGILTEPARDALIRSLSRIVELDTQYGPDQPADRMPHRYAAEHDAFLEGSMGHPQLLALARSILGQEIRYDHCVALIRASANPGLRWHTHEYADDDPRLGFLRIFFYVNGFEPDDGGLKAVPGSHLFRDSVVKAETDRELEQTWLAGKRHPLTGEPLRIEHLSAPPGSVLLMWTHALHGVTPRRPTSPTRWCVVYGYRNPGRLSRSRWLSEEFERKAIAGAEGLMSLY